MTGNIQSPSPSPGSQGPTPLGSSAPASFSPGQGGGGGDPLAAWSKMFGGMATPDELKKIITLVLNDAINQIKKEQAKARETLKKMKQDIEDNS